MIRPVLCHSCGGFHAADGDCPVLNAPPPAPGAELPPFSPDVQPHPTATRARLYIEADSLRAEASLLDVSDFDPDPIRIAVCRADVFREDEAVRTAFLEFCKVAAASLLTKRGMPPASQWGPVEISEGGKPA